MCYFSSTDQITSLIHHLQILFPMNLLNHRVFFKDILVGRGVKGPRAHDLRTVAIFGEYYYSPWLVKLKNKKKFNDHLQFD